MKKYIIERELKDIGSASPADLKAAAQKSSAAIAELGPGIQWLHSYVTQNKTVCVYAAKNEDIIRKHSELSGFPADLIFEVKGMIDVTTGA